MGICLVNCFFRLKRLLVFFVIIKNIFFGYKVGYKTLHFFMENWFFQATAKCFFRLKNWFLGATIRKFLFPLKYFIDGNLFG